MKNITFKLVMTTLFMLASSAVASAQQSFVLRQASSVYDVRVKIAACDEDSCEGVATVELIKKSNKALVQKIELANLFLELGDDRKPTANVIELYGDNSGIVFDDFNFDGIQDIALRAGNDGAYGGPSYDIMVFSPRQRKFVIHEKLTELASENLGLFRVDRKAKTLTTFNKSGCCWHQTERYVIRNNRPVKVYVVIEDATRADEKVEVTTMRLVNGRWRKTTRLYAIDKYYK